MSVYIIKILHSREKNRNKLLTFVHSNCVINLTPTKKKTQREKFVDDKLLITNTGNIIYIKCHVFWREHSSHDFS
jgi:hypothetical protein